jgi:hypothetical protein
VSYAIAPTFEANKIGVRRAYTLGRAGFAGLGDVNDTAQGMISEGYDPNIIYPLVTFGATDAQLQNLWNSYGANTQEFTDAANGLLSYLKSTPNLQAPPVNMQTSAAGAVYGAAAAAGNTIVSVAGQVFDLTQEAGWNSLASLINFWQQQIQQTARLSPNDPGTIANVSQFNQGVTQFSGYYQQVMSQSSNPSSVSVSPVTLGIIPVIAIVGIVAAVAALIAGMYAIYQYFATKRQQQTATAQVQTTAITGAQASANNLLTGAAALLAQANSLPPSQSAQAAQIRAQAAAMQQQAGVLIGQTVSTTAPQPSQLSTWFTQNWVGVAAVLLGVAVLPALVKKL